MPIPVNMRSHCFGTVQFWKSAAPYYRARSWKGAMRGFALQHGKAIAMLANDGAIIIERGAMRANGTYPLIRHELAPDSVAWHDGAPRHV
jgi:hypothetical protein